MATAQLDATSVEAGDRLRAIAGEEGRDLVDVPTMSSPAGCGRS